MAIKGLSPAASAAVRSKTLQNESKGNYQQPGNPLGFIGGYQFGTAALQDVGLIRPGTFDPKLSINQNNAKLSDPNNWTIQGGKQAFLNNPQLQDRAFDQYATRNINTLTRLGVVGPNTPEADIAGYTMASHIGGAGGARDLANGKIRTDANGTTTAKYFRDGKTAASQAQQEPQPLSELESVNLIANPPVTSVVAGGPQPLPSTDPQVRLAAEYGTQAGSQQTLLLAEQDSWFATNNGKGVPGQTTDPIPNPLTKFSTFSYFITLGCIPKEMLETMDGYGTIILQSANGLPNNRQPIASGIWDFYINELDIESLIGFERMSNGTNVTMINFEVIEPYSLGLFLESLQASAQLLRYNNYAEASFCLTIEFVGWDDEGNATQLKDVRRVALRFTNIEMDISTRGSRYKVQAIPWSQYGLTDQFAKFQSDINFYCDHDGPYTVRDLLKTAEVSLEKAVNLRFAELQKKATSELTPDSIEIKFGPNTSDIEDSLVSFDYQTGGTDSNLKAEDIYENNAVNRKKVNSNPNNKGFTFSQGTTIISAITEALLQSEYCRNNIKAKIENPTGMIDWFKIETEVRNNGDEDGRGRPPRIITYKIVKYKVHSSKVTHQSAKPDYNSLLSNVVKVYDYIYTGKNTEVLNFNINLKFGFFTTAFADLNKAQSDINYAQQNGAGREAVKNIIETYDPSNSAETDTGNPQATTGALIGDRTSPVGTLAMDELRLISKTFHEKLLNTPEEMMIAEIEILGDPYYLISSGTGNVSSSTHNGENQTPTGEIDYQSGEVDVVVNFRTPVDINDKTGIVDFASTEVAQGFSGLYHIIRVENKFRNGKFTQTLHAVRRPNQAKGSKALKQATEAPSISPLNSRINEYIDQRRNEGPVSISDTGSG
jgi:hypothetical protein